MELWWSAYSTLVLPTPVDGLSGPPGGRNRGLQPAGLIPRPPGTFEQAQSVHFEEPQASALSPTTPLEPEEEECGKPQLPRNQATCHWSQVWPAPPGRQPELQACSFVGRSASAHLIPLIEHEHQFVFLSGN